MNWVRFDQCVDNDHKPTKSSKIRIILKIKKYIYWSVSSYQTEIARS